jgi:hypothetical protein
VSFALGFGAGVVSTIIIAFIGGYLARVRDPRHNKWGFDDR